MLEAYPLRVDVRRRARRAADPLAQPDRRGLATASTANEHQLALSEPARANAIHGLLRWRPWRALERSPSRVVMGARLHPMTGYPFALDVRIAYELSELGLEVTTDATNVGREPLPLRLRPAPVPRRPGRRAPRSMTASSSCRRRPGSSTSRRTRCRSRASPSRAPRSTSAARACSARTDSTTPSPSSIATPRASRRARLHCPDGHTVALWVDGAYRFLQVFSGDTLTPERRRRGLAVEPMSCAANAFRSGDGLITLSPGETTSALWGVQLVPSRAASA